MKRTTPQTEPQITDEPGMAERFQRGLQRAFQTPHKPITPKLRPTSQRRVPSKKRG